MIEQIISTGQAGIAATALDVAIKLGLDYCGWCHGRQSVPQKYRLTRLPDSGRRTASERCIAAADGVIFFTDTDSRSLALEATKKCAWQLNTPILIQQLAVDSGFSVSRLIAGWITDNQIKRLHVDGESVDTDTDSMAASVANILEATFFLSMVDSSITSPLDAAGHKEGFTDRETPPATMDAALLHLQRRLSLKDKATIANMVADELLSLQSTLGNYINGQFDLFTSNRALLMDCQRASGRAELAPEDAAAVIIRALWERLQATCRIRIVK